MAETHYSQPGHSSFFGQSTETIALLRMIIPWLPDRKGCETTRFAFDESNHLKDCGLLLVAMEKSNPDRKLLSRKHPKSVHLLWKVSTNIPSFEGGHGLFALVARLDEEAHFQTSPLIVFEGFDDERCQASSFEIVIPKEAGNGDRRKGASIRLQREKESSLKAFFDFEP